MKTKILFTTLLLWVTWPAICIVNPIPHGGDYCIASNDGPIGVNSAAHSVGARYGFASHWNDLNWLGGEEPGHIVSISGLLGLVLAIPWLWLLAKHLLLLAVCWNASDIFWRGNGGAKTAATLAYAAFWIATTAVMRAWPTIVWLAGVYATFGGLGLFIFSQPGMFYRSPNHL